jgi:hypothetical protein
MRATGIRRVREPKENLSTKRRTFMPYAEIDSELLILAANLNLKEVSSRIREMTTNDRKLLRRALDHIDKSLYEVSLEENFEKIRERLFDEMST